MDSIANTHGHSYAQADQYVDAIADANRYAHTPDAHADRDSYEHTGATHKHTAATHCHQETPSAEADSDTHSLALLSVRT